MGITETTTKRRRPTIKQQRVGRLLSENYGNSMGEVMLKAGYSPSSAKNPRLSLPNNEIAKQAVFDVVQGMKKAIELAVASTVKRLESGDVKQSDLTEIVDKFQRNVQLLSGMATSNVAFRFVDSEDESVKSTVETIEKGDNKAE
jgi:hypothetical protein